VVRRVTRAGRAARVDRMTWAGLGLVLALAAVLRLWRIHDVPGNVFYDAAVRSMGTSWHAFFFGALEPGASVSIDKPPLDLWLQVGSTKLLGFGLVGLHLPEALAGVAGCALLFGVLRREFGTPAALIAAAALAVTPISVLTARSDTMDSLLAALQLLALWLAWKATLDGRRRWTLLSAAVMGVAFNVKLSEALVVLPALLLLWTWAASASRTAPASKGAAVSRGAAAARGKAAAWLGTLLPAGAVFVATALSWATLASLTPAAQRPYPIGSATGSIWRLIFVYNGWDRLLGHGAVAMSSQTSGAGAGPLRLLNPGVSRYGTLIGVELLTALLLVGVAIAALLNDRRTRQVNTGEPRDRRLRLAVTFATWGACGLVMFSAMSRLQARYLETLAVPTCALLGIAAGELLRRAAGISKQARRQTAKAVLATLLVAVGAASLSTDRDVIRRDQTDAGQPDPTTVALSRYLRAHRDGARYEVVSSSVFDVVGVVARDALPVIVLDDVHGRVEPLARLRERVRSGQARYYLTIHGCHTGRHCPANAKWAYAHSTPVRAFAGLRRFTGG
jgi:4-amino-4-deoxy-L-arabinose transferase-like glycosyltransferase